MIGYLGYQVKSGFSLLWKKLGHSIFFYDFYKRKKTLFSNVETQIIWSELKNTIQILK